MLKESDESFYMSPKKTPNLDSKDGRYQTLFQQVNAAAFLITLDGIILEANQKSCDLLGYSWENLLKISFKDIILNYNDWTNIIDELSAKGGLNFETKIIRKDGTHCQVDVSTSLFTLEKKPVILSLIWDITERKKVEYNLKASEQKYQGLFECTIDGMLVLDSRGEILDINSKASELLGKEKDKLIGKNFLSMDLLLPKAISIVVKQFQELLSNKKSTTNETEIKNKDKKLINVELSSFFLIKKDNEIDNFVLVIRDISNRKQTEQQLAQEHDLLQTLMNNVSDSIYFKDEENKFILVNKAKAMSYNSEPEKMIGKTDFDFLLPDQAKKAFDDDEEIIKTGKFIFNKVERIINKDDLDKWVSITKIPRFDTEGNIIGTMGISRDITQFLKEYINSLPR